jgi:repressor LexA
VPNLPVPSLENLETIATMVDLGLTERQAEIFIFLFENTCRQGYQPSMREVMIAFDFHGTNAVACHFDALDRKGWIEVSGHWSRAVRFLRNPDGSAFTGLVPKG